MKPTEQQLKVLQEYLHKTLNYRETYEEIYDHILSALEFQPGAISFQDAVNAIILNDFGGHENLLKVEKAQKDALVSDMYKKYKSYLISYFKLPNLIYLLLAWAAAYFNFTHIVINMVWLAIAAFIAILVPYVIYLLRYYTTGYILGTTQKSAKDKSFETLASVPIRAFVILNALAVWSGAGFYNVLKANSFVLVTFFIAAVVFNLSLYKLYKSEFNAASAK